MDNENQTPKHILLSSQKAELADTRVSDQQLLTPRPLLSLTESDLPLEPLPPDTCDDLQYNQIHEPRCTLCRSIHRLRAEHVYLENGRKPMAVVNFFSKYYGAKVSWECVATHMENHCDFRHIVTSGLKNYERMRDELAPWLLREHELAEIALMTELNDIRGMDCKRNPDLKLKRASMVDKLLKTLIDLKAKRDEAALDFINPFDVLTRLATKMVADEDRQIILSEIQSLRMALSNSTTLEA